MNNAIRPLQFACLIAMSLRCWAEPAVIVLSDQTPSEDEFIRAIQAVPTTNWVEATLSYPSGLGGVPLLSHAVIFGMTNAVEMIVKGYSKYTLKPGSMFDPVEAAIGSKNWGLLERLLSSEMGMRLDGCDCCYYLERLPSDPAQAPQSEHFERLAVGCATCGQKGRANDLLLAAITKTNIALVKVLMRAGADPRYSFGRNRVVAMGNADLEDRLIRELETNAFVRLSSSGAMLMIGGEHVDLANEALDTHDWRRTLESASAESGFHSVLIEIMDSEGARILRNAVQPVAAEIELSIFLREQSPPTSVLWFDNRSP